MKKRFIKKYLLIALLVLSLAFQNVFPSVGVKADDTVPFTFILTYDQSGPDGNGGARAMIDSINTYRSQHGEYAGQKSPMIYDYALEKVAMQRAAELVLEFDEKRPDGGDYKNTLSEFGFYTANDSAWRYGEGYIFGEGDSYDTYSEALTIMAGDEKTSKLITGFFTTVGISHVVIDEDKHVWVQIFCTKEKNIEEPTEAIDGAVQVTVKVSSTLITANNVSINHVSGETTVAAGSSISAPVDIPSVTVNGSYVLDGTSVKMPAVSFETSSDCLSISNGTITGVKAGTGTISANVFGKTVSYDITVTGGNTEPDPGAGSTTTDPGTGTGAGSTTTEPGTGTGTGSTTSDPGTGTGAGSTTTDPGTGTGAGSTTTDPGTGTGTGTGSTTTDPGTGTGSTTTDLGAGTGAGSTTTDPGTGTGTGTGSTTTDPGTGTGSTTTDPGTSTGGSTAGGTTGGSTSTGGTTTNPGTSTGSSTTGGTTTGGTTGGSTSTGGTTTTNPGTSTGGTTTGNSTTGGTTTGGSNSTGGTTTNPDTSTGGTTGGSTTGNSTTGGTTTGGSNSTGGSTTTNPDTSTGGTTGNSTTGGTTTGGSTSTSGSTTTNSGTATGSDSNTTPDQTTDSLKVGDTVKKSGSSYTVSSNGKIEVTKVSTKDKTVKIPSTITKDGKKYKVEKISASTFSGNTTVKKVTLSNNIKVLPKNLFKGCTSLKEVKLPSKLTTISKNTFNGCTNLKKLVFTGAKVTSIDKKAFAKIKGKIEFSVPKADEEYFKKLIKKMGLSKKITLTTY